MSSEKKQTYLDDNLAILIDRLPSHFHFLLLLTLDRDVEIRPRLPRDIPQVQGKFQRISVGSRLVQHLGTDEHREQRIQQILVQVRLVVNVLPRQRVVLVEEKQDCHLVGRQLKDGSVRNVPDIRSVQLTLAQLPQPCEPPVLVFRVVECLKVIDGVGKSCRRRKGRGGGRKVPKLGAEDQERGIQLRRAPVMGGGSVRFVVGIEIFGGLDVLKHPLQLVAVLETAFFFQVTDHHHLSIVRGRHSRDKTLRQITPVDVLEDVLVSDKLEDGDLHRRKRK